VGLQAGGPAVRGTGSGFPEVGCLLPSPGADGGLMYFLIETTDAPGSAALRETHRPEHVAYLTDNLAVVLTAGAKLDDAGEKSHGSMYVVDVPDRAAAEAFLAGDPFMRSGVIGEWTITRWRKGFFDHRRVPQDPR
jgi:uncharacterized protein